ncbi:putative transposase, partial [Albidovulum inexpectatum]
MISNTEAPPLEGYRFPRSIIAYAVWAYHGFAFSLRDVEGL